MYVEGYTLECPDSVWIVGSCVVVSSISILPNNGCDVTVTGSSVVVIKLLTKTSQEIRISIVNLFKYMVAKAAF